jgi:phosphopantothenoylcysteine decarboxylase/phosphopantothenate--cysteine ligase
VLENRNILLGVTGSIAVYKSVDLARRLKDKGANVTVVMTGSAQRFVAPLTFETALGSPVYTDLFEGYVSHIRLVKDTHLLVVAPATANTVGKMACGIADNLLTTLWLAYDGPALIAPAMNSGMLRNPIVKKNLKRLAKTGVTFVGPESGSLACGDVGVGRMADVSDIIEASESALSVKDLSGQRFLVTAGPTREPIDPVRYISNRSSGKMGFAIAKAAFRRGAEVTLISGPTEQKPPMGINYIAVEKAADMENAVQKACHNSSTLVMAAAVSDFSSSTTSRRKIKKSDASSLTLKKTSDILKKIGKNKGKLLLIGFAAETGRNIKKAEDKLKDKNLDLIVLNDLTQKGSGFDVDTNIVTLIDRRGKIIDYPLMGKDKVAEVILDAIADLKSKKENKHRKPSTHD